MLEMASSYTGEQYKQMPCVRIQLDAGLINTFWTNDKITLCCTLPPWSNNYTSIDVILLPGRQTQCHIMKKPNAHTFQIGLG